MGRALRRLLRAVALLARREPTHRNLAGANEVPRAPRQDARSVEQPRLADARESAGRQSEKPKPMSVEQTQSKGQIPSVGSGSLVRRINDLLCQKNATGVSAAEIMDEIRTSFGTTRFGVLTAREIKLLRRACRAMESGEQDFRDESEATYGDFAPAIRHRADSVRRERRWTRLRNKLSSSNK